MRILIGVSHPKHVYIFKNIISSLSSKGHDVKVVAVKKEVTTHLLDQLGIQYEVVGQNRRSLLGKLLELVYMEINTFNVAQKFKPDIFVGRALPHLAHVSWVLKKSFIIFEDTEIASAVHKLTLPFAKYVITPYCYKGSFNEKHIRFNGFFELAYLDKEAFSPIPGVLDEIGVKEGEEYILLRFVSWNATHDKGYSGLNNQMKLEYIHSLEKYGKVLVSSEEKLPSSFDNYIINLSPEKLHTLLYNATLCISEGGTVAAEAALLGTPSIYVSPFGGIMGNFIELEKARILYCYVDYSTAIEKAIQFLSSKYLQDEFKTNSDEFARKSDNVRSFLVKMIEEGAYVE